MPNAASDLATHIATLSPLGGVTLAVDTNVFTGPPRGVNALAPWQAVFCHNVPGSKPEPYCGEDADFYRYQVEVIVRSEPGEFAAAETLAFNLLGGLQRNPPSGYVTLLCQQSAPDYLGSDDERLHLFRLIVELWYKG